jgi:hypothetical protein
MGHNERKAKQRNEGRRADAHRAPANGIEQPHRLRGSESADDFTDADADSCVASRHRSSEKESDS